MISIQKVQVEFKGKLILGFSFSALHRIQLKFHHRKLGSARASQTLQTALLTNNNSAKDKRGLGQTEPINPSEIKKKKSFYAWNTMEGCKAISPAVAGGTERKLSLK